MEIFIAPLALLLERQIGYPARLVKAIGHPVIWQGQLIAILEKKLNPPGLTRRTGRLRGVLMLVLLLLATLLVTVPMSLGLRLLPFGWVVEALLATTLLAQKELGRAVRAVGDGLGRSLADGRQAVSLIVGRDPDRLDEAGTARAAIESLAESSSDAVVAPLFWLMLLGLPGIAVYKAINTADSMVGHKTARYRHFGWASARIDDLVNWVPARLTALAIAAAAFFLRGADPEAAWSTALRDAKKHESPNAGWPEAAMAGALGFALGGPRHYEGEAVELPQFGEGRAALGAPDIYRALALYWTMLNVVLALTLVLAVIVWI
jgi:adenosylcobinamide-phosphate synthase